MNCSIYTFLHCLSRTISMKFRPHTKLRVSPNELQYLYFPTLPVKNYFNEFRPHTKLHVSSNELQYLYFPTLPVKQYFRKYCPVYNDDVSQYVIDQRGSSRPWLPDLHNSVFLLALSQMDLAVLIQLAGSSDFVNGRDLFSVDIGATLCDQPTGLSLG
jgi:hypothetical protein